MSGWVIHLVHQGVIAPTVGDSKVGGRKTFHSWSSRISSNRKTMARALQQPVGKSSCEKLAKLQSVPREKLHPILAYDWKEQLASRIRPMVSRRGERMVTPGK